MVGEAVLEKSALVSEPAHQLLASRRVDMLRDSALLDSVNNPDEQIAQHFRISPRTSQVYLRKIYRKLGVLDNGAAVITAISKGILSLDDILCAKVGQLETGFEGLTPAEESVLHAVYYSALEKGSTSNAVLAEALHIKERTVDAHLHHIYGKLGIHSPRRPQLAVVACAYVKWKEDLAKQPVAETPDNNQLSQDEFWSLMLLGALDPGSIEKRMSNAKVDHAPMAEVRHSIYGKLNVTDDFSAVAVGLSTGMLPLEVMIGEKLKDLQKGVAALTNSQKEVVRLLYDSALNYRVASNAQVAASPSRSIRTIEEHFSAVYEKMDFLASRAQLATVACYLIREPYSFVLLSHFHYSLPQ